MKGTDQGGAVDGEDGVSDICAGLSMVFLLPILLDIPVSIYRYIYIKMWVPIYNAEDEVSQVVENLNLPCHIYIISWLGPMQRKCDEISQIFASTRRRKSIAT